MPDGPYQDTGPGRRKYPRRAFTYPVRVVGPDAVQWDGAYLDDYKLSAALERIPSEQYAIQLIEDDAPNAETLAVLRDLQGSEPQVQRALGYVNVVATLERSALGSVAVRPDVVSIQPRPQPQRFDERQ